MDVDKALGLAVLSGLLEPIDYCRLGFIKSVRSADGRFAILRDELYWQGSAAGAMFPMFTQYKMVVDGKTVMSQMVHVQDVDLHCLWSDRQKRWLCLKLAAQAESLHRHYYRPGHVIRAEGTLFVVISNEDIRHRGRDRRAFKCRWFGLGKKPKRAHNIREFIYDPDPNAPKEDKCESTVT